jgi:HAD superfamily hydrolase (TIGR01509 family)
MKNLRALIFDVDGTLAETEEIHRQSFNLAFAEAGLAWRWDKVQYQSLLTTTGGKERIARFIAEQGLLGFTDASIASLHLAKNRIYADTVSRGEVSLRPGVARLMTDARAAGLKLGIATTTSRSNLMALLHSSFGPASEKGFNAIICGEDVQRKKPDLQVYQLCLSQMVVAPSAAMAFEDSAVGLKAALAAGIRTVVTPSAYTANDDFTGASLILPDLAEFHIT